MSSLSKGKYRHFKGNLYQVIDIARHSENQEEFVVYRALYGEGGLWIRPLSMFVETIERDGVQMKRFALIEATELDS
ncbi:MAG: hypothetical protein COC19_04035 [SAR86 cluster bacterium]|uniref:DUF1653 domain-containing protein n=1 Tax=SAR86 cluster bacterium TaxID=2030880 RepID=A0A2A4MPM3_9GAMM|nr:MAG: hypothetical protein COC19_04035 [SAR86 cluster bacterium]